MAINKVIYGNNTLIDLTDTTATAEDVVSGKTFYKNDGTKETGILSNSGSYTLLATEEYQVTTTSSGVSQVAYLNIGTEGITKDKILYVRIRDKAGKRPGYFLGTDCFYINHRKANGSSTSINTAGKILLRYSDSSQYGIYCFGTNGYGVFPSALEQDGRLQICTAYDSFYSLKVDGTYKVDVYLLDFPDGVSPFDI